MRVKIRRDSIRPNPTAGNTIYVRNIGSPQISMVRVVKLANGKYRRKEYVGFRKANGSLQVQICGASTHTAHPHPESDVRVLQTQEQETIHSLYPEVSHLFQYEDPTVQCAACGESCLVSELRSDSDEDNYTDEMCPHCLAWHVLDDERILFERLDEALKELSMQQMNLVSNVAEPV